MPPIFVWWIGGEEVDPDLLDDVRRQLALAFRRPAVVWHGAGRPDHAFDPRRKQHASAVVLRWLLEAGPPDGKVLGITDRDLFIPILTYVFGEAQLGGGAAVLSLARLQDDVARRGRRLLEDRVVKEAVHEVGHAFGLLHCHAPGCVMTRSPAVREVDDKGLELCADCRAQIEATTQGAE